MERSSDVDELHAVFPDLSRSRGTLQLFVHLLTCCRQPKLAFGKDARRMVFNRSIFSDRAIITTVLSSYLICKATNHNAPWMSSLLFLSCGNQLFQHLVSDLKRFRVLIAL